MNQSEKEMDEVRRQVEWENEIIKKSIVYTNNEILKTIESIRIISDNEIEARERGERKKESSESIFLGNFLEVIKGLILLVFMLFFPSIVLYYGVAWLVAIASIIFFIGGLIEASSLFTLKMFCLICFLFSPFLLSYLTAVRLAKRQDNLREKWVPIIRKERGLPDLSGSLTLAGESGQLTIASSPGSLTFADEITETIRRH